MENIVIATVPDNGIINIPGVIENYKLPEVNTGIINIPGLSSTYKLSDISDNNYANVFINVERTRPAIEEKQYNPRNKEEIEYDYADIAKSFMARSPDCLGEILHNIQNIPIEMKKEMLTHSANVKRAYCEACNKEAPSFRFTYMVPQFSTGATVTCSDDCTIIANINKANKIQLTDEGRKKILNEFSDARKMEILKSTVGYKCALKGCDNENTCMKALVVMENIDERTVMNQRYEGKKEKWLIHLPICSKEHGDKIMERKIKLLMEMKYMIGILYYNKEEYERIINVKTYICGKCKKECENERICNKCEVVAYCSEKCEREDKEKHDKECVPIKNQGKSRARK